MSTAWRTWEPESGRRWDAHAEANNPEALLRAAHGAADDLRIGVSAFEHSLARSSPKERARLREMHAPTYYDLHRAERLTRAQNAREASAAADAHMRTSKIARALAEGNPESLEAARARVQEDYPDASADDIAREYMLWKHSLALSHIDDLVPHAIGVPAEMFEPRHPNLDEIDNLDDALRETYGNHTRSPKAARIAFADLPAHTWVRGTTTPAGHMIVGRLPGNGSGVPEANRKTGLEQMAHSLLARHLLREADAYRWHTGRKNDPFALAMAHGVFDRPDINTFSERAPSDFDVHYAARVFGVRPKHDAGQFRSEE